VTGKDLIARGMQAGPKFREILDNIKERQAKGTLRDRQEALEYPEKYGVRIFCQRINYFPPSRCTNEHRETVSPDGHKVIRRAAAGTGKGSGKISAILEETPRIHLRKDPRSHIGADQAQAMQEE